jgi:hypothetical protein
MHSGVDVTEEIGTFGWVCTCLPGTPEAVAVELTLNKTTSVQGRQTDFRFMLDGNTLDCSRLITSHLSRRR